MNVVPFIAHSVADAVTQIRERLGPEAVVLNVRPLPASGLTRLWTRPRIEVLAYAPDNGSPHQPGENPREETPPEAAPLLDVHDSSEPCVPSPSSNENEESRPSGPAFAEVPPRPGAASARHEWQSRHVLEAMGITPMHANRVLQHLRKEYGEQSPASLRSELAITRAALTSLWRSHRPNSRGLHVLVGPPGSGKSTALAKWLTQIILLEGGRARVWRLDVPRANTAEGLSVHCEALNVPVERVWNPAVTWPEEHLFVDLPGIDPSDAGAIAQVQGLLSTMPGATVSLVLNAAYETTLLEKQVRAFAPLPISSLIFTHLDEETRWSKLWNFVLGTDYSLSFLGAGQNIPGQFVPATPEALFPATLRDNPGDLPMDNPLANRLLSHFKPRTA